MRSLTPLRPARGWPQTHRAANTGQRYGRCSLHAAQPPAHSRCCGSRRCPGRQPASTFPRQPVGLHGDRRPVRRDNWAGLLRGRLQLRAARRRIHLPLHQRAGVKPWSGSRGRRREVCVWRGGGWEAAQIHSCGEAVQCHQPTVMSAHVGADLARAPAMPCRHFRPLGGVLYSPARPSLCRPRPSARSQQQPALGDIEFS